MVESALKRWLRVAEPGENFIYHVGPTMSGKQAPPVIAEARRHEMLEVIVLKQRRLSDTGIYEYIAERVSRNTIKTIKKLNAQISADETLGRAVARRAFTA
jgi:hypothetical protein